MLDKQSLEKSLNQGVKLKEKLQSSLIKDISLIYHIRDSSYASSMSNSQILYSFHDDNGDCKYIIERDYLPINDKNISNLEVIDNIIIDKIKHIKNIDRHNQFLRKQIEDLF